MAKPAVIDDILEETEAMHGGIIATLPEDMKDLKGLPSSDPCGNGFEITAGVSGKGPWKH